MSRRVGDRRQAGWRHPSRAGSTRLPARMDTGAEMGSLLRVATAFALAAGLPAADSVLRGRLRQEPGKPPVIETSGRETSGRKSYTVSGDEFTRAQMADPKLNGREMQLEGRFTGSGEFEALRIFTIQNGKRFRATYWCDVCAIRTHMPGRCMCCQADTTLEELPVP